MKDLMCIHTYQKVLDLTLTNVLSHGEAIQQAIDAAKIAAALMPDFMPRNEVWVYTYQKVLDLTLIRSSSHEEAIRQAVDAARTAAAFMPDFTPKIDLTSPPPAPIKRGRGRPPKEKSE